MAHVRHFSDRRYRSAHEYCGKLRIKSLQLERQIKEFVDEKIRLNNEVKLAKSSEGRRILSEQLQKHLKVLDRLRKSKADTDSRIVDIESQL